MRRFILILGFVGSLGVAIAGAQTPDPPPIVQIGVSVVFSGGAGSGGAYITGRHASDALKGTVYTGPCSAGAGGESLPVQTRHAWRIEGQVVSLTADEAVVQVDWQRILADGQPVTSPAGSVRQTLHSGERVTLDSVNDPTGCGQAQPATRTFEVRFGPAGFLGRAGDGGRAGGALPGPGGGGGGGRAGSESSGGGGSGRGGGGGGISSGAARVMPAFDVDLWLVHAAPNREDEVMHQTLRLSGTPMPFQFAPVKIAVSQGNLTVLILGSVGINTAAETNRQFVFAADRRIAFVSQSRPARDPAPDAQGGTKMTDALPGPDEVVSFEMPPFRVPDGGPAVADRFAIRVRITPVKAR